MVRQYSRAGVFRFLRDVIVVDKWADLEAQIKAKEQSIEEDLRKIDSKTLNVMDSKLSQVGDKVEQSLTLLKEFAVKFEVRNSTRGRMRHTLMIAPENGPGQVTYCGRSVI
jgi:recombinational DNA repair ATPase RecF